MGDGEHDATLDRRRASAATGQSSTPGPRVARGAAPWERFPEPSHENSSPDEPSEKVGSHARGGLSVADLIAKVGAPTLDRPSHRHVAPDAEPSEASPDVAADQQDPETIEIPAYSFQVASELPYLGATTYPTGDTASPKTAKSDRKSGRRPMLLVGRSLAAVFSVLALILTGGAWQWSTSKNARLNTVSALDPHSGDIRDPNGQYGDEDFLIVGIDSRLGENANMGAGDADDADGARSDTIMLVNIPANRKRVVAVSFPRDLAITPMQCEAWNAENGKYGPVYNKKRGTWSPRIVDTETKLNSTFSFGGPRCLVKEIQKLSGLSINRFIAVDFAGFAKMVDALGGVQVCTSIPLHDYELGTVLEHAGRQVIDGPTALNYVRARQVTTETNGDYGRIKRQQLFLSSLLRSLISEDTLLDLNKLNNVVNMFIGDTYVDNVKTKDLVQLGQSLQGMAAGHITFVTVPTGITDENGDEPPRMDDVRSLFDAIINDDPLPQENDHNAKSLGTPPSSGSTSAPTTKKVPTPTPAAPPHAQREQVVTTSPQDVTVRVSNATTQSGLATTATSQLKRNGFNVMTPDDYPSSVNATTVLFSPGNEQAAATVASAFANAKVQRVTGYGQVVQVVLGPDFNAVTAPAPSGSSVTLQIDRGSSNPPATLPEDLTVTNAADTTCE
jgi:LCP family protein required for cell wall assembly